ncbi:TPA: helix-turn-helix domain-containing protein [Legionella pneumophila]|uniref:helix-turn-helix domain-containing protein n=1 Tax=Legionella pneumophila TaxID=446 RepID=UPI0009B472C0|nr:helix-turn-helix domain-containing protein [Legionella pneumophila]HAT8884752.1 helix-turn-helix domain-containing protein [Legionella pneumophila subsp. pneumophila]MDW8860616.1 helix-turn-helix domain-containing protein [Legionella pneumophila]MDW8909398.1 helix-turn-helix domain-containing protein [Legionella pneumophila]HAT8370032.1 helix-turn-helix domain-containing protein [Legionella pneumophila]HAT8669320.1 helix-turn-helix domain-containing protein [Legionella pneumophila]
MNNYNDKGNNCNTKTLDIIQAANFLGIHKETARRLAASGELPGVKIGRAWRFIEQDIVEFMRSQYYSIKELSICDSRSNKQWQSQKEITSGGLTSRTRENEYVKALGLK